MKRREFLVAAGTGVAAMGVQGGSIEVVVPEDGGTPRDPRRIVRVGEREFRVAASVEEGSSPLKHAVSRIDLIVRNPGAAAEVVFHFDLSGEGKRPLFDQSHFGGMPKRDYVYVQAPGQVWRRVDGSTDGWVATVRFMAQTGDTKLGLSPWYTYGDYLAYVASLPGHPHLRKEVIGKSDGGRPHWEFTITDPGTPAEQKKRIFWHAREHAYESFSSLAIEGLVEFLLSPMAAEYRRQFVITLHPMTNVDGVAGGYEYRGGYDYPTPRGAATGRLTFETVDRLRPHYAVAWHNWIAPRDVDVVFYTDGENGAASRRAWDLFTQRFPSPRAVGHRWDSQYNPLEKNWFGRKLGETNVHEYAMKLYGTRIWGWEMPWWGRDEGDPLVNARKHGADFGWAFLGTIGEAPPLPNGRGSVERVEVRCREMHEFSMRGQSHVDNPFRDATLVGEFRSPSGKLIAVEGFYCGEDLWKLRFVPEEPGEWEYRLRGEGVGLFQEGRMIAIPALERGFIRIHPENPYAFAHADGSAFFPMGDTCYGLHDDTPITPELRREYLETRRRQNFNFVRMSIGHSAKRAAADPQYWAWGGTAANPDLDRLNPRFFESLEAVLRQMQSAGMNAELLLFNYYRLPFTDPKQWTAGRERMWLRHVMARLASFPNVFLLTLSNEYETHPDGKYRLDVPGDVEWAKSTARMVRELDPYRHPVTVHPVVSASAHGPSPRDKFDAPWRIGEFYGKAESIEVLSQQTASVYRSHWDERLKCWMGDAAGVEKSIAADRVYRKPVLNTENGYEYLPGYATNRQQVYHTDRVRRAAWRIVCAGGYFAAGFISTLGHGDPWDVIDPAHKHPFLVKDAGAAGQLAALYRFFQGTPYWRMSPMEEGCLGCEGEVYVMYLPHGGKVGMDLSAYEVKWFNPRSGEFVENAAMDSPDGEDWAVLARRKF